MTGIEPVTVLHATVPNDLISGRWLRHDAAEPDGTYRYRKAYCGTIVFESPTCVAWLADRETANQVLLDQQAAIADSDEPDLLLDLDWQDENLVFNPSRQNDGIIAPDRHGRYLIDFGWGWTRVIDADETIGSPERNPR